MNQCNLIIQNEIIDKFNGLNAAKLAADYKITPQAIFRILKANRKKTNSITIMGVKMVLSDQPCCQWLLKNPRWILIRKNTQRYHHEHPK